MDKKDKKELSESDIKAKFITPAIGKAGWIVQDKKTNKPLRKQLYKL